MTHNIHGSWRVFCLCVPILFVSAGTNSGARTEARMGEERRIGFNDGWRFFKGEARGAELPGFADSTWREVQLPHDWAIEGPFDRKYSPDCGALPFHGIAWYRKAFSGLCLLIVRSQHGQQGNIRIAAASDGLRSAETAVSTSAE